MIEVVPFTGFRPQLLEFLRDLTANNTREWFQAHQSEYQDYLMQPARDFVQAMGCLLRELDLEIRAEPRVYGSILPITRDTRFSKDKTPYKTHLDLWFWHPINEAPNRDCPGYFLRITADALMLGAGMHRFPAAAQSAFRRAVQDEQHVRKLQQAVVDLEGYTLGGRTLKRAPKDNEWLRHTGLYADRTEPLSEQLHSAELPRWCLEHYRRLAPLQQWLLETLRE